VSSKKRIEILDIIFSEAKKYGFENQDIIVDGLVMTVSSKQSAAIETLNVIEYTANKLKTSSITGLSNISFGLPERRYINAAFLAMAMAKGLTAAIANPADELFTAVKRAANVLSNRDSKCAEYISAYSEISYAHNKIDASKTKEPGEELFNAVVNGNTETAIASVKILLEKPMSAGEIVDKYLVPAINKTGDFYEKKVFFLPQLISSAETMKASFDILEPLLQKNGITKKKKKIVMATVFGDIHDIGKNIVCLMLKNYGFDVIDLGKNISAEEIVEAAVKESAEAIGLSALMTTTMPQMKRVIDILNAQKKSIRVIIGGAVITQNYADEIGAYAYSKDALEAVKILEGIK